MTRSSLLARLAPTILVAAATLGYLASNRPAAASSRPYVTGQNVPGCAAAVAYLERHAEPHFAIECPVNLSGSELSVTCIPAIWPAGCPETPVIRLSVGVCRTGVQDEASNSWVLWTYAQSGQIPQRVRQGGVPDYPGQYGLDNYGEC